MAMGGQGIRRGAVRYFAALAAVVLCTFALCVEAHAAAATARKTAPSAPLVEGVRVHQIGSSQILVELRGTDMPLPASSNAGGAAIALYWRGARFPQNTDRKDWWDDFGWDVLRIEKGKSERWTRRYEDIPLVDEIRVSPSEGGVIMEIIGPRRLAVKSISGMAGSSRHRLILEAPPDVPSAPAPKPKPLPPGDPLSVSEPVALELRDVPLSDHNFVRRRAVPRGLRVSAAHARPFVRRFRKNSRSRLALRRGEDSRHGHDAPLQRLLRRY